jgi:hypothetical protein
VTEPGVGGRTYVQGIDYTVEPSPGGVTLRRVPGMAIPFQQAVLVDYLTNPQPENTSTTNTFTVGGRYDFEQGFLNGAGVYARYTQQDQSIDSDDPSVFIPNSFTDIVFGADYRYRWLTLGAERETHDSTIFPFNANRYYAHWLHRFSADTTYSVNINYDQVDYPDEDNHVDFLTLAGTFQHRFTRELYGNAMVLWRNEDDQLRGTTRGLEEQIELQWTHRQTTVYGLFRNAQLESERTDNSFQMFEVGIRREF